MSLTFNWDGDFNVNGEIKKNGVPIGTDITIEDIRSNYIDNSNFSVNTNGQTEYAYVDTSIYTVDRWYIDGGSLIPVENGVQFVNPNTADGGTSSLIRLKQNIHYGFDEFAGKTLTLSAKINGTVYTGTATIPIEKPTEGTAVQYIAVGIADFGINLNYSVTADYFVPYFALAYNRSALIEWMKLEVNDEFSGYVEPDYMTELIKMNFTTSDKGALDIPTGDSYDDTEIKEDIATLETSLANKADKDNLVIYTKEYLPELISQGSRGQEYYYNKTIQSGNKLIGFDYIDSYFYIGIYGLGVIKVHQDEFYKLERVDSNELERILIFSDVFTYGAVSKVITRKNKANQIEFFVMYSGSTSPVEVYNTETNRCMSVELGGFGGNVTDMFKSANNRMFFYNQNFGVLGKLEEMSDYYPVHITIQCSTNGIIDWSTDYTNNTGLTIFVFDDDIIYDIPDYTELESWKERYQSDFGTEGTLLGGTSTILHIECWEEGVFFVTSEGQLAFNYYNKQEENWELPWSEQPLGGSLGYLDEPNPDYMFINTNNFLNCLTETGIKVIEGNPEGFNQVDLCLYENPVYPQYFDKSKCVYANHKLSCMFDNTIYVFEYNSEDRDMSDVVLALEDRIIELEAEIENIKRHVGIE